MTTEQQALADMPVWLVIVLSLIGGVSGEMWRADKAPAAVGKVYSSMRGKIAGIVTPALPELGEVLEEHAQA